MYLRKITTPRFIENFMDLEGVNIFASDSAYSVVTLFLLLEEMNIPSALPLLGPGNATEESKEETPLQDLSSDENDQNDVVVADGVRKNGQYVAVSKNSILRVWLGTKETPNKLDYIPFFLHVPFT